MKRLLSVVIAAAALFVCLGIPALCYAPRITALLGDGTDAVSSASLLLPDQPSGEFVILLNAAKHPGTLDAWEDFFLERDVDVIFEDLDCVVVDSDAPGIQLAERYQARLAENQMTVKRENATLAASKAQWGAYDVLMMSGEMADVCVLSTAYGNPDVHVIVVKGGEA